MPVTVYQGQLDLICCTLGAQAWMVRRPPARGPSDVASLLTDLGGLGASPPAPGPHGRAILPTGWGAVRIRLASSGRTVGVACLHTYAQQVSTDFQPCAPSPPPSPPSPALAPPHYTHTVSLPHTRSRTHMRARTHPLSTSSLTLHEKQAPNVVCKHSARLSSTLYIY